MKSKKFMKALNKNRDNLDQIVAMYYERKLFENTVKDRTYEKIYYVHNVEDIFNMFHINSICELIALLHYHVGEKLGDCPYCGLEKSRVETRTSMNGYNTIDCRHEGICTLCKEPYIYANKEQVCNSCTWEKDTRERERRHYGEANSIYRFVSYIGRANGENIETVQEAEAMMSIAADYYAYFESIKNQLLEHYEPALFERFVQKKSEDLWDGIIKFKK